MVIRSNKTKVSLPFNANLGVVLLQTFADQEEFQDAADHTADQLASSWLKFVEATSNNQFCSSFQQEQFIANDFCFSSRQDVVPIRLMGHLPTWGSPTTPPLKHGSCMHKLLKWLGLGWILLFCPLSF